MGTSLTGLTPATTYDALIKVGDNGPLSATAKYLSDGLGNDSVLALSTTAVGIGTTSPSRTLDVNGVIRTQNAGSAGAPSIELGTSPQGNGLFSPITNTLAFTTNDNERMRITSAGNVGIGTSSPLAKLQTTTAGTAANEVGLRLNNPNGNVAPTGVDIVFQSGYTTGVDGAAIIRGGRNTAGTDSYITFQTNSGSGLAEVGRWLPTGGLTFNGDTAAANALDDYEEGTFTATITPSTSGTIVLSPSTCSYTKIGRQVTVRGQIVVSAVSSPVGSIVILGGLPFTSQNSVSSRGAGVFQYFPSVGTGSLLLNYQLQNSVEVNLILDASTIGAGAEFYVSLTYFV